MFSFITTSIRRKILVCFLGVFFLLLCIAAFAEWQLLHIRELSAKAAPRGKQMKAMQDLVAATTELDVKLERFLLIRSASEHKSLMDAQEKFLQRLHDFLHQDTSKTAPSSTTSILHDKGEALKQLLDKLLIGTPTSFKSRQLNEMMSGIFVLIKDIDELEKQWSANTLTVFEQESSQQEKIVSEMNLNFIVLGVGVLLLMFFSSFFIARSIAAPVQDLMEAAKLISNGQLNARAPIKTSDEIGKLAKIFNHMADQLQNLILRLEERMQQLKNSSDALKVSEDNLRITLQSIADAVIATDDKGNVLRMNSAAEALTGWSDAEAKGHSLNEVFNIRDETTGKPIHNLIDETLVGHKTSSLPEHTILTSLNGQEYRVADSAAPIRAKAGNIVGLVLVFRDITEEYELHLRLRQSQKMDAIGQLAGGVAHDFNNMLGGITGAAEIIQLRTKQGKEIDSYIKMILDTAERASELTGKLLAFARKQPLESIPIDLNLPLKDAISLLQSTADKRIKVVEELTLEQLFVMGDASQLQSAFLNLLINSVHAMPEGGQLFITSRITEIDEVFCRNSTFDITPGHYAQIKIRDTGHGISKQKLPHIFEPFFTTKDRGKGTGLGLAAVLGTVQQHKGAIHVYSEEGTGTSFSLIFPISKKSPKYTQDSPLDITFSGSGTILIVDDEHIMRTTASKILEDLGYVVLLAEDGLQGLELFKREKDRINLVIMDMIMPELNGRDCFLAMREVDPNVKVILSSGFSREEEVQTMKTAGLKGFIHKPYRASDLSRVIHEALRD